MKVIQTINSIYNQSAGPSHSVPGLCKALQENGVDVQLLASGLFPAGRKFDFPVFCHPRNRFPVERLCFSRAFKRHMRTVAETADIVHNNGLWLMPNIYSYSQIRHDRVKYVISPRGSLSKAALSISPVKKRIMGFCGQWAALRGADMFHVTSRKEYEEVRTLGYRQPIALIPIGMDIPPAHAASRLRYKTPGMKMIAFFGRVHPSKAADHLILAWSEIATQFPDWEVVIAGPDCGAVASLNSLIEERHVPRVRLIGELVANQKYDFLFEADLYSLPSLTENFGITIAEALACGVPAIASKGAPWRILEETGCGWWHEIGADDLRRCLLCALSLPEAGLKAMGAKGRSLIEREFAWRAVGAKTKAAYEWLLQGGEKPEFVLTD